MAVFHRSLFTSLLMLSAPGVWATTSDTSTTARSTTAMKSMQTWYNQTTGLWDTCHWWNSANCMTTLADLVLVHDQVRDEVVDVFENTFAHAGASHGGPKSDGKTYKHVDSDNFNVTLWLDDSYDDDLWWAVAWLAAYDVTKTPKYQELGAAIFDSVTKNWPTDCGNGGIWWDHNHDFVNAITNELFFAVAALLANRAPDSDKSKYLDWAERSWTWFSKSGLINDQNTINDGLSGECKNNGDTTWTYNQGVVLGGLVELNKAKSDQSYLDTAEKIAKAAIAENADDNGVFKESCEPDDCTLDQRQFKGIFIRNLKLLNDVRPNDDFARVITASADSIWKNDKDNQGRFGVQWAGPVNQVDASSHSSGFAALVASIDTKA